MKYPNGQEKNQGNMFEILLFVEALYEGTV